ncbi:MAG TPA: GNAT family N-acetyltransferase, partial [Flavobacteriales bacterium]|nr:GNAT family N-acetyltransferase [Flavobacteriales bacterium]
MAANTIRMSAYDLAPVNTSDADIVQAANLLRGVFPDARHFSEDALRWQYRDNPDGEVVGFNARLEGVLAAHYVAIPLVATVDGREERGLLSLNTATHPSHQGKGLFTKLANATYAHAAEQGFGFVIGVANANSTHGFVKKLGFQLVSPLRAMVGIGPLPYRTTGAKVRYERVWSPAALRWRLAHPCYPYMLKHAGNTRLVLSERTQFGARYVLGAARDGRFDGLAPTTNEGVRMKAWIGLDPDLDWAGSLYVNVPMRLRPSPLNLILKDLTGRGRTLDADGIRFSPLDFD